MSAMPKITEISKCRWFTPAMVTLIFIPLLFLNIRHDHDWGGDFAQYMAQADNIVHFRAMENTGYVYNEAFPSLAPKAYPPGFPLIIAPVTAIFGNAIPPYNYLISLFLIATAVTTVLLLQKKAGIWAAIALSIIIYYNPYLVKFKSEVMADIPFSFLVAVFVSMVHKQESLSGRRWIFAGLIAGYAAATKTAGASLLAALMIYSLQQMISSFISEKKIRKAIGMASGPMKGLAAGIGLSVVFSLLFLHSDKGSLSYLNTFSFSNILSSVSLNIFGYAEVIRYFFAGAAAPSHWVAALAGSAMIIFFITGLFLSFTQKPGVLEWTTLVYFGVLFIYPYQNSGFRFLIPIVPLMLYYIIHTATSLKNARGGTLIAVFTMVMMCIQYFPMLNDLQHSTQTIQEGPYKSNVVSAFRQIQSLTPENALIVFKKPLVLARYTGRQSMSHTPDASVKQLQEQFNQKEASYFLLYSGLPDEALENYLKNQSKNMALVWIDQDFKLYQKK